MPETKRPLKVFLCHAKADKPKVRELYRYLRKRGIKPWFDEVDLVGGQDWQVEIPKAIATSDAIIICLTKNSVDKEGYIQKEIKFALDKALEMPEGRIFLIPIRFEECDVPFSLSRYQWVDLFDQAGYIKMMKALKFRATQLERTTVDVPKITVAAENLGLENVERKGAEREVAEKTTREKAERESDEKRAQLIAERESAVKAARERERLERETARKATPERANRELADTSIPNTKSIFLKTKPFLRVAGMIGIILGLILAGSWAVPKLVSLVPMAKVSSTSTFASPRVNTDSPVPLFKTLTPDLTLTNTNTPTSTLTATLLPTVTFEPRTINWGDSQINWSGEPISPDNAVRLVELAKLQVGAWNWGRGIGMGLLPKVAISQDGSLIAYILGLYGKTVSVIYTYDGKIVELAQASSPIDCFGINLDGSLLAYESGKSITVLRVKDDSLVNVVENPEGGCPIALSQDGSLLLSSSRQNVYVYRVSDGTLVKVLSDQNLNSSNYYLDNRAPFSSDGRLLVTTNKDGVNVWDIKDWTVVHTIANNYSPVFSSDGSLLASIADDQTITIWKSSDWSEFLTLNDITLHSPPLFFTSNGDVLVSGSDNIIRLWRVSDGNPIRDIDLSHLYVQDWTISGDGSFLVIATNTSNWATSGNTYIRLWGVSE